MHSVILVSKSRSTGFSHLGRKVKVNWTKSSGKYVKVESSRLSRPGK